MSTTEELSGVVEAKNERGIRIQGEWLNQSRFRHVDLPEVGQHVRATFDSKGFLTDVQVLDGEIAEPGYEYQPSPLATRLEVLRLAAAFGASRPDVKSGDVLKIADSWVAWVQQS